MSDVLLELMERISGDVEDLDDVVRRARSAWPAAQRASGTLNVHLDSVALNLHGFYCGVERLFELIARHVDQAPLEGRTWHRNLLERMADDMEDLRPAVICAQSAYELDAFRRFRHLVQNVYVMHLVPDRMAALMVALPGLWTRLRQELLAFADFLEDLRQTGVYGA